MSENDRISLKPSHWLDPVNSGEEPLTGEFNVPALLAANVAKMHQHQSTCQWIRTWSFALVSAFFGYVFVLGKNHWALIAATLGMETVLFCILLKDIGWHSPFWKYRNRARLCEAYLIGRVPKKDFRTEYLQAEEPSRAELLGDAFSPKKLLLVKTDFVETYLMIVLGISVAVRWYITK